MKRNDQNSFNLDSIEKKNIFLIPENYFESLDKSIENRILELNASCKKQVFRLPELYFEQSAISIIQKINRESFLDNPELKESVFKAPEGYLVSMEDEIKAKISSEMETKENHFAIPEDYFETLSDKIQDKIGEKDNVIKFDFASSPVLRYSIAASVALVLAASALFYVVRNQEQTVAIETKSDDQLAKVLLASLDKSEVKLYLEKQEEDVETHELMEFTSDKKKGEIKSDFEKEIISASISEAEKQAIELEMNDIDVSELESDI